MSDLPMSLNQPQRTALASNLLHLEQSLNEIERVLAGPPAGITYTTEVDFEAATADQIRAKCREIRVQIADLAATFQLAPHRWVGRRIIAAEMSTAWANLEDMRLPKLRRYGAVDPALQETLAPRLNRLIDLVVAVRDLVSQDEE